MTATAAMTAASSGQAHTFSTGANLVNLESPVMMAKPIPTEGCVFSPADPHSVLETVFEMPEVLTQDTDAHIMSLQLMDSLEDANDFDWSFVPKAVLDHKVATVSCKETIPAQNEFQSAEVRLDETPHLRVKVAWMNGEVSWTAAAPLQAQNPWVIANHAC